MNAQVVVVLDAASGGAGAPDLPLVAGRRAVWTDPRGVVALAHAEQPRCVVVAVGIETLTEQPLLARLRAVAPDSQLVVAAGHDEGPDSELVVAAGHDEGPDIEQALVGVEPRAPAATLRSARLVPGRRSAPAEARSFVWEVLLGWRCDELVQNALLVVSELVSNAVFHAGGPVEVALALGPVAVRIEVRDTGQGTPEVLDPDRHRRGGRGLHILTELASWWGIRPTPDGKVVWAELAR